MIGVARVAQRFHDRAAVVIAILIGEGIGFRLPMSCSVALLSDQPSSAPKD